MVPHSYALRTGLYLKYMIMFTICTAFLLLFSGHLTRNIEPGTNQPRPKIISTIIVDNTDSRFNVGRQDEPRQICNCSSSINKQHPQNHVIQSTCSDEATCLGGNQKVISYSLFLRDEKSKLGNSGYFQGVRENLAGMKKFYPGWVMRIYSNVPLEEDMCAIICSDQDIYYCDVSILPGIGDVRQVHPMAWRFLLIGDETVEQFAVRDLDSRLSQRERDAVDDWETSEFAIHGMRDHPQHRTHIMGGMWGVNNLKLGLSIGAKIRLGIMDNKWKELGYNDQHILSQEIYSQYKDLILTHDSYLCLVYKDSVPFPTKRFKNNRFVGQPVFTKDEPSPLPSHCPTECRPEYGRDWEYC